MTTSYKSFIAALALMLGMGITTAHAKGPVHQAVDDVSDYVYKIFQKDEKFIEKVSSKLYEEAKNGDEALRKWCGDHKETCAKEIADFAKEVEELAKKMIEDWGEEFVKEVIEEVPEILKDAAEIGADV
jgi:hypothetical protein